MSRPVTRWEGIVLHHTAVRGDPATLQTPSIRRHHVEDREWRDIGYHFVVELNGEVLAGRPLNMSGAHCPGKNGDHLGVAFAGHFVHEEPSEEQLEVGARFLAGLCVELGISPEAISAHRDHRSTVCPGNAFPLARLVGRVREEVNR